MKDSLQHQIALVAASQIGPITAKTLVAHCGSALAVFESSARSLLKIPGIGPVVVKSLQDPGIFQVADREMRFLDEHDIHPIFFTDTHYPARLRQCADSPVLLFFKGSDPALLAPLRMVAIVGTRTPTDYGRALCEEFIEQIAVYQPVIISGLAYGIDITAHRKATALGIPNIGTLGHGLGAIYPHDHKSTALRMCENGGLLSEFLHHTKPDRENFPMRNRIIAGLSDALLVVETADSGGSMISAQLAHQYEREVFAFPGRVHDSRSAGCNLLIKGNRARLIESAADLAEMMGWNQENQPRAIQTQLFPELNAEEKTVYDIIRQQAEIPVDALSLAAGIAPGALASLILHLEFKGLVRTLPGKRYVVV